MEMAVIEGQRKRCQKRVRSDEYVTDRRKQKEGKALDGHENVQRKKK